MTGAADDPLERLRALSEPASLIDPAIVAKVLDALPDCVIVIDADGIMKLVNAQCELMFGYHRSDLLGQPIEMLLPPALRERHRAHREQFFMDPHVRPMGIGGVLKGCHRSGAEIAIEVNLSPLVTPVGIYAMAIGRRPRA